MHLHCCTELCSRLLLESFRCHLLPLCLLLLLSSLSDAITGLDVTADGSYVLATTRHYLLVIPTSVEGQEKSGFKQSITAKASAPIKLQLDPTDMATYGIKELHFTPAHFNTGEGQEEYISTSTGEYVVTWNFTAIKKGKRFRYKSGERKRDADAHVRCAHWDGSASLLSCLTSP